MKTKKKKNIGNVRRVVNYIVLTITIMVSLGLIVTAWCSHISPGTWRMAPFGPLVFPVMFFAIWLVFILDVIWWRRTSLIALAAMIVCYPQMRDFAPINIPKGKMSEEQMQRSFTIMTYNVWQFDNQRPDPHRSSNEQLDYILSVQPDIVCIEESHSLVPTAGNCITQEQLADLGEAYPYIFVQNEQIAMLSKFRAETIPINFPTEDFSTGNIAAWRMDIHGETVNLFLVHLQSFGLTQDDRGLFKNLTTPDDINKQELRELREAKQELLPKVVASALDRNRQVELLIGYLNKYGGKNVIVCGDFNDPVGCYELHMLEDRCGMRQVYTEAGFGPTVTYNANHFLYRIDHILYRGDLTPWDIHRGKIKASDHYPLVATMLVGK